MKTSDQEFLAYAASDRIRCSARSICIADDHLLAVRSSGDLDGNFHFIGGGLLKGETLSERLRIEYAEEVGGQVTKCEYLFLVENRFDVNGKPFHGIEHYFQVELASYDVSAQEADLTHGWFPVGRLREFDIRPHIIRDAVQDETWRSLRHFVVT